MNILYGLLFCVALVMGSVVHAQNCDELQAEISKKRAAFYDVSFNHELLRREKALILEYRQKPELASFKTTRLENLTVEIENEESSKLEAKTLLDSAVARRRAQCE